MATLMLRGVPVIVVAVALVASGCRNENEKQVETSPTTASQAAALPASDAARAAQSSTADLLTQLASPFESHAFLLASGVLAAARYGFDSPVVESARKALEDNAVSLADTISPVFGAEVADRFRQAWTEHTSHAIEYARARSAGDEAAAGRVRELMGRTAAEAGRLLGDAAAASGPSDVDADAIRAAVAKHVPELAAAIDTFAVPEPPATPEIHHAFEKLLTSATSLVGEPPLLLTRAATRSFPERYATAASAPGVEFRYRLDHSLEEHTYLAGLLAEAIIQRGVASDLVRAADRAVKNSTEALAKLMEPFFGNVVVEDFRKLWENEVTALRGYAEAKATGNDELAAKMSEDLDAVATLVGRFLAPRVGGDETVWKERFKIHVDSLRTAVDALAADKPEISPLKEAAEAVSQFGDPLALALAERHPDKVDG